MNAKQTTHTPTPWKISTRDPSTIVSGKRWVATSSRNGVLVDDMMYNAAHIVRCVNSHDALLAACKELAADLASHATFGLNAREVAMLRRAEAAIQLAEPPSRDAAPAK